ncbi:hypothetical protein CGLO_18207 [Colletotrichum gloeosporioides Cg-14]|uniref:Uncharacterized protein n=1 Tax=Colletotrichum gloeosporioides (strain Cg-14) TaxID=1237896 RepID=T0JUY1_COLGC|nr:hypothetical protein CGLO_18207 [Colletotrichum gloeosporioides Cg-14]
MSTTHRFKKSAKQFKRIADGVLRAFFFPNWKIAQHSSIYNGTNAF